MRNVSALARFYGSLPSPPKRLFPLFVWEVLAAHTSPGRRDAAFAALKRVPALTPDAMWRAPEQQVLAGVLLAGPYAEQRMGALRSGVRLFRRTPSLEGAARKPLRTAMRALEALPHPGGDRAVARLLLFAGDHFVFPVDSGIERVVTRLQGAAPDVNVRRSMRAARLAVTRTLPRSLDRWREAAVYLSHHAATTCTETDPHCSVCPLRSDCAFGTGRLR